MALSTVGAAFGTSKAGIGIAGLGTFRPDLIMKSLIPVVVSNRCLEQNKADDQMSGSMSIAIIMLFILINSYRGVRPSCIRLDSRQQYVYGSFQLTIVSPTEPYSLFAGFVHLGAGLACGFTGLAAGYAIGIVGDAVRF